MAAILSFLARVMICAIFFLSAVGKKIPNFQGTVKQMEDVGIPQAQVVLIVAVVFLILGSTLVVLGYLARLGALLLLIFLALATYYFHSFWTMAPADVRYQVEMTNALKNLGLAGAMLFIIANGPGAGSIDSLRKPTF